MPCARLAAASYSSWCRLKSSSCCPLQSTRVVLSVGRGHFPWCVTADSRMAMRTRRFTSKMRFLAASARGHAARSLERRVASATCCRSSSRSTLCSAWRRKEAPDAIAAEANSSAAWWISRCDWIFTDQEERARTSLLPFLLLSLPVQPRQAPAAFSLSHTDDWTASLDTCTKRAWSPGGTPCCS